MKGRWLAVCDSGPTLSKNRDVTRKLAMSEAFFA